MVKGVSRLLLNDLPLCVERHNLEDATKSIHEDDKKEQVCAAVETSCVGGQVVENTRNDQALEDVRDKHGKGDAGVADEHLDSSPEVDGKLLPVGEIERRLFSLSASLVKPSRLRETLQIWSVERVLFNVVVDGIDESGTLLALLPYLSELV
jgi:hypothetical protein